MTRTASGSRSVSARSSSRRGGHAAPELVKSGHKLASMLPLPLPRRSSAVKRAWEGGVAQI